MSFNAHQSKPGQSRALGLSATVVLVALTFASCSHNEGRPSIATSCTDLADALGMPHDGQETIEETADGFRFTKGELVCRLSPTGEVRSIVCMALASKYGQGVPVILDREDAIDLAQEGLEGTHYRLSGEIVVRGEPWEDGLPSVVVSAQPEAFGYPTLGFAGGIDVELNRFTGDIQSIHFSGERTVDPPAIEVTREQAAQIGRQVWNESEWQGSETGHRVGLQYFFPSGSSATPAGRRYEQANRVRMCWVVKFFYESSDGTPEGTFYSPLAAVVIDAETGEVLTKP